MTTPTHEPVTFGERPLRIEDVLALANRQAALVGLAIALARAKPGAGGNGLEAVTLAQQIHVDNTP